MVNINIEYKNKDGNYPVFFGKIANKKICVACDKNTRKFAEPMIEKLKSSGCMINLTYFPDEELVPNVKAIEKFNGGVIGCDYALAVGSGTLNDLAKYVSFNAGIPCGVLATAPSMDGYCSSGAALIVGDKKVSYQTHIPSDVLIDPDIIVNAPRIMIASGFGDIMGKYTCLTDWRLSNILNGEDINELAYGKMLDAREACAANCEALSSGDKNATAKLIDALITAGLSMAECGNSRPASGSEHHMSHFLEMDFVRRGERIPMHGLKVAIGTLISMELYKFIKKSGVEIPQKNRVYELIDSLPDIKYVEGMLVKMGCPTRFSLLGVRRETMEDMIEKAYTVRDRYTVLTFIHDLGLTENVKPIIMEKYF